MICAWEIQNVKSTSTTFIVARIPKMPMYFQNSAASSRCIAVSKPFPWYERTTSSRTEETVSSNSNATVKIGRQSSQPRRRGMKYIPDSRQNCRPQRVRRIRNQPTSAKPTTTRTHTPKTHSRLCNHSVDQLTDGIFPPSFGPTKGGLTLTPDRHPEGPAHCSGTHAGRLCNAWRITQPATFASPLHKRIEHRYHKQGQHGRGHQATNHDDCQRPGDEGPASSQTKRHGNQCEDRRASRHDD